ncbi:MAG: cardiolipin synthase [Verrucomicrobiota bacterium]|nr:cardiolipin synthase [Verrucomicrobiota bacterium]
MEQETFDLTFWVVFSSALHLLAFTGVALHALQRRRNASATILWIFVAWSFPLFGPLLYISFGIDRVPGKGMATKAANQLMQLQRTKRHEESGPFIAWHLDYRTDTAKLENGQSRKLNMTIDVLNPEHPLLDGNRIEPLFGGDEAYPLMLQAIRAAKHHIHMQSFIIHRDGTGQMFLDALKTKAGEGVKVRLMFDTFGSTHAYLGGMFREYAKIPNLEIQGWTQANPLKRQFQINLRNHRKNLVVDGETAFFGGVNIAGENTTSNGRKAIRDYHFKVAGPLVHELQYSFLRDWFFMTEEPIDSLLNPRHFPKMKEAGEARARIIDSGPSAPPELVGEAFFNAIVMAQTQILIVTPYFVPTTDLLKALRSAARRGVDVCIVVPEKNNHRYAGMASKALYEELMSAGVRIFLRQPPFIHAKAMVVDDSIALVGTANLDVRSLELNYETTVLFEGQESVNKLKLMVVEDTSLSTELNLNEWLQRPSLQKLGENLCALMTPVL